MKILKIILMIITFEVIPLLFQLVILPLLGLGIGILCTIPRVLNAYKDRSVQRICNFIISLFAIYVHSFTGAFYSCLVYVVYNSLGGAWYIKALLSATLLPLIFATIKESAIEIKNKQLLIMEAGYNSDPEESYMIFVKALGHKYSHFILISFVVFSITSWETVLYGDIPAIIARFCKWW